MPTDEQKARVKELLVMLRSIPPANVDLNDFYDNRFVLLPDGSREPHFDSSTVACVAVWACAWPKFKEQGLKLVDNGLNTPYFCPEYKDLACFDALQIFFGESHIFKPYRGLYSDADLLRGRVFLDDTRDNGHHYLAVKRIEALLSTDAWK